MIERTPANGLYNPEHPLNANAEIPRVAVLIRTLGVYRADDQVEPLTWECVIGRRLAGGLLNTRLEQWRGAVVRSVGVLFDEFPYPRDDLVHLSTCPAGEL